MYMSYERLCPKRKRGGNRGKTGYAVVYEGQHQKGECEEIGRSTSSVTYYGFSASLSICVGRGIPTVERRQRAR